MSRFPLHAAALALALAGAPAAAQQNSTSVPFEIRVPPFTAGKPEFVAFQVDDSGALVASGEIGVGLIPASGPGYRTMWYPFKAAFRSGGVSGTAWDQDSVGFYSWAGGVDTVAAGTGSFAFGEASTVSASAPYGAAFGVRHAVTASVGFTAGADNACSGVACVALGQRVRAEANNALVLGRQARSGAFNGTFVWADASQPSSNDPATFFSAAAPHEFAARASGGFRLRTRADAGTGCNLAAGSGVWECTSDVNEKADLRAEDAESALARLASLPITSWTYRGAPEGGRHVGPTAQDFHAAFGLGASERTIGHTDLAGVNTLAIQALERRTRELSAVRGEVEGLREELATLRARNAALERDREETLRRLERLERRAAEE